MLRWVVLAVSLAVLLTAASVGNAAPGRPQLICVDAGEAGLAGKPPLIAGYVVSRGAWRPTQLYINGTVIKTVGIWDANSTKPQIQALAVLPPAVEGLVCFPPGDPAPAKKGLYLEVEARGRRHGVTIINATEDPAAPPALPLEYALQHFELIRGRVVRKAVRDPAAARDAAQAKPLSLITPGPSHFRDFSGQIVAVFKLRQTDNYVLTLNGAQAACASGTFMLPNGTSSFTITFTPATRADVYGGASSLMLSIVYFIYDESNNLLDSKNVNVNIPSSPRPWYMVTVDLSRWVDKTKRINLYICKPLGIYVYGRYIIDAFIYSVVPAKSYAQTFALASPGQNTAVAPPPSVAQLFNGTYIVVPGFTPPPGYVLGSARALITLKTCASNAPASINVYWGPFFIGTVSKIQGSDGCWYYVITPAMFTSAFNTAARASLYLGGLIHNVAVGPFNWDTYRRGIAIQQMRIEGLYRPEMNARSSAAFRNYHLNWGIYTLSGFMSIVDNYSGGIYYYGDRIDLKLYTTGDLYYVPQFVISVAKYNGMQFHCPRVEVVVGARSNGVSVPLYYRGSVGTYTEGGSGLVDFVDLVVSFISNMFENTAKWISTVLGGISWPLFAIDLVQAASDVNVRVEQVGGDLRYIITLGPLAPDKIVIDGATLLPGFGGDVSVTFVIKQVSMCSVTYGDYSAYLDPTARLISRSNIHLFRTFTCGKQEIYPDPKVTVRCDSTLYG